MKIVLIFLLLFCTFSDCKKLKPKCNCGLPTSKTRNDRIFRGHDALPHQYPWQILMEIKVKNKVFQNGGVLVSKKPCSFPNPVTKIGSGAKSDPRLDGNFIFLTFRDHFRVASWWGSEELWYQKNRVHSRTC